MMQGIAAPTGRGRRRSWLLAGLGLLFAASALLRLGDLDMAFATPSGPDDATGTSLAGPTSPLRGALDEVEALRARLEGREEALADRERAVAAAQTLVEARLAELEAAEARLRTLISVSDAAAETDIAQLTQVYEAMEPTQAAALFTQMDPSFAAGFLSRMAAPASAALMAELAPEVAYAISVTIATRNAGAPRLAAEAPLAPPDG